MWPVRLLLRSQGLKVIIEALFASLKPMAYATLFLLIVCTIFSVTGMAFCRKKFHSWNDMSLDGLLGQGKVECAGNFYTDKDVYFPRRWARPPWGSHFDSLDSSIAVFFKCLTLNWAKYYTYAQDAYLVDVQPVPGINMAVSSLFFHLFLLIGSFSGLNLFASFMCDTFYPLQGTAQLEKVQWMAVKAMLAAHQPKKHRVPLKNMFSTLLREILSSTYWQNISALCLLLNVTFMGSVHSNQDASFDEFLDVQNTVFFGFMCAEAGLHLLSLGPRKNVMNASLIFF